MLRFFSLIRTRVNGREDRESDKKDQKYVETLWKAFLEDQPIGWADFYTTCSGCHALFLFLPFDALLIITIISL